MTKRVLTLSGLAVLWVGSQTMAQDISPDAQLHRLEARLAVLENQPALVSKESAAIIDDVLRDAQSRSQLLATADSGAGYDNGFFIRTGQFLLRPGVIFQFRHIADYRQGKASSDRPDDKSDDGFEVRLLRFYLAGSAFSNNLQYFLVWDTFRDSGDVTLLEAWARYMLDDQWGIRGGQIKNEVSHESLLPARMSLAVESSMATNLIGGYSAGYIQAAELVYGNYNPNNPISAQLALSDGARSGNTDFTPHEFDWGAGGRLEWKALGNWANYQDFTAKGTREQLLVLAGGFDLSQKGDGDWLLASIDAQYKHPSGLTLYSSVMWRHLTADPSPTGQATDDWGALVQAGYLLGEAWEVFARADLVKFDNPVPAVGDEDLFQELTVGVSYYLGKNGSAGNGAKITVDLTWLPNSAPVALKTLGIQDVNDGNDQWVLRTQFQLAI